MDGVLGETACVGGHGKVGEHGGVARRGGIEYGSVGGGDEGGAGGKRGLGHVPGRMDGFGLVD